MKRIIEDSNGKQVAFQTVFLIGVTFIQCFDNRWAIELVLSGNVTINLMYDNEVVATKVFKDMHEYLDVRR